MDKAERIKIVRAMETIARCVNDEEVLYYWLSFGVADGDIDDNTTDDELDYYVGDDDIFADLMQTFLSCMKDAYRSGGLYVDDVVSKWLDE